MKQATSAQLKKIGGSNGELLTITDGLPFIPVRVFWITELNYGDSRGGHAHKKCGQVIYVVSGKINLVVNYNHYSLDSRTPHGIYVPAMNWVDIFSEQEDTSVLVLASDPYDESDYIRDRKEFLRLLNPVQQSDPANEDSADCNPGSD